MINLFMKKIFFIILLPFLLSSCASVDERLSDYRSMNERELCMSYLLASTGNVWQEERLQVIDEKSYDCNKYIPEAELRLGKRLVEQLENR
jgi:hypothetical protein